MSEKNVQTFIKTFRSNKLKFQVGQDSRVKTDGVLFHVTELTKKIN